MKKRILSIIMTMVCCLTMAAQSATSAAVSAADKIIGNYQAESGGKVSKVKIYKYKDGYRAQVYWVKEPKNPDGSVKLDKKNPDKAKAKLPVSQAVLIDKVTYEDGVWKNGKIYNPENGKTYTVEIKFKDAKTLAVRGSIFGIGKTVYWPRIAQ